MDEKDVMVTLDHLTGFAIERKTFSTMLSLNDHGIKLNRGELLFLIKLIIPRMYQNLYIRIPCKRLLRYVGMEGVEDDAPFIKGNLYHSMDFNGGTYTIELPEGNTVIGLAYFERVSGDAKRINQKLIKIWREKCSKMFFLIHGLARIMAPSFRFSGKKS